MGWLEDAADEFRKLPPAGKLAVGAAGVGVALLAYAQYRSRQSGASASAANSAGTGGALSTISTGPGSWFSNGTGSTGTGLPAVPFPTPIRPPRPGPAPYRPPAGQAGIVAPGPSGGERFIGPATWSTRAAQTITFSAGGRAI